MLESQNKFREDKLNNSILLNRSGDGYDINIIIGENGSGKSEFLNSVAKECIESSRNVIAIATSVHDKFDIRSRHFHFFGGRQGRNMVEKLVKKTLHSSKNLDIDKVKHLVRALEYSGYRKTIGIRVEGYNPENKVKLEHDLNIDKQDKIEMENILLNYSENFGYEDIPGSSEMLHLNLSALSSSNIENTTLSSILKHEMYLKRNKIIGSIKLYLENKFNTVELKNASSGELMMISTLLHISSNIKENSVIIIDEPENSLHPKWQKEYLTKILDLFYYYSPKIIVASHSPLIIPLGDQKAKLFRLSNYQLEEIASESSNNEEIMSSIFNIITPENRYLSDHLINLINKYEDNLVSYNDVIEEIELIKSKIYDCRQFDFIDGVVDIVEKMKTLKADQND